MTRPKTPKERIHFIAQFFENMPGVIYSFGHAGPNLVGARVAREFAKAWVRVDEAIYH